MELVFPTVLAVCTKNRKKGTSTAHKAVFVLQTIQVVIKSNSVKWVSFG